MSEKEMPAPDEINDKENENAPLNIPKEYVDLLRKLNEESRSSTLSEKRMREMLEESNKLWERLKAEGKIIEK